MLKILMEKVDLVLPAALCATIRLISKESGKLEAVASSKPRTKPEWRAANSGSLHEFAKIVLKNKIP